MEMNPIIEAAKDDEWLTPPDILERLGHFDLDPCAATVRPWPTAQLHYTKADNGLRFEWHGRAWCNPPYSKLNGKSQVELWMKRMAAHKNGLALVNVRSETQWFFDYLWRQAHALFFFEGRIRFYRPDGTVGDTGRNASALAAFSQADAAILYQAGFGGKFIPLIIQLAADLRSTWRQFVRRLFQECGGKATLEQLYQLAAGHPKLLTNPNWKAKIRQTVQRTGTRIGPALWQTALL